MILRETKVFEHYIKNIFKSLFIYNLFIYSLHVH